MRFMPVITESLTVQIFQIYFDKKSWYSGTIEPSDFDEKNELSQIEKKNIDLIKKYE